MARFAIWARTSLWRGVGWDQRMALAITATIILHNICVEHKDPAFQVYDAIPDIFDTDDFIVAGPLPDAITIRHQLALFIWTRWSINEEGYAVRR